jgi:transposase
MSLSYELFHKIKHLFGVRKMSAAQISTKLELDKRTVRKCLEKPAFSPRKPCVRASKLDPFKEEVKRLLEEYPYSSAQIFGRLRDQGYQGGRSILKEYVRLVRPRCEKAFLTLRHDKGECAQVDWGTYGTVPTGQGSRRLSFFVMVLGYSRLMYLHFTVQETLEQFLECHRRALEFFGGVPRKIVIDNLKTGVLEHVPGLPARFHPRYLEMAQHYGFEPVACNPRKPHEKGQVENGVGYVKGNLLGGHDFPSLGAVQSAGQVWLHDTANVRIHASTGQRPSDLFEEERPLLLPLHPIPYDTSVSREQRVSSQFRVTVDTNRYSVPWRHASKRVQVKLSMDRVCIYDQDNLLARHARSYDRRQDFEDPEHVRELLAHRQKAASGKLLNRFISLHECAERYYRELDLRRANVAGHIRNIMALHDLYGTDELVRALQAALRFEAFGSDYITHLLEVGRRMHEQPAPIRLTRESRQLELDLQPPNLDIYEL